jgi:hypothetical protein
MSARRQPPTDAPPATHVPARPQVDRAHAAASKDFAAARGLPVWFGAVLLALYAATFSAAYWAHRLLPEPRPSPRLSEILPRQDPLAPWPAPFLAFSEARARAHLRDIAALGVRLVGMESNEDAVPRIILEHVAQLAGSAGPGVTVEVAQQTVSGAFPLDFLDGFTNVYSNITNIVVRVRNPLLPAGV